MDLGVLALGGVVVSAFDRRLPLYDSNMWAARASPHDLLVDCEGFGVDHSARSGNLWSPFLWVRFGCVLRTLSATLFSKFDSKITIDHKYLLVVVGPYSDPNCHRDMITGHSPEIFKRTG